MPQLPKLPKLKSEIAATLTIYGSHGIYGNCGNRHRGQRPPPPPNPTGMIYGLVILLVVFWAIGFSLHVAGSMIHALLIFAFVILLIHLLTGRKLA